jgi:hypothetical protein
VHHVLPARADGGDDLQLQRGRRHCAPGLGSPSPTSPSARGDRIVAPRVRSASLTLPTRGPPRARDELKSLSFRLLSARSAPPRPLRAPPVTSVLASFAGARRSITLDFGRQLCAPGVSRDLFCATARASGRVILSGNHRVEATPAPRAQPPVFSARTADDPQVALGGKRPTACIASRARRCRRTTKCSRSL